MTLRLHAGEIFFGFIEEDGNKDGTVGGRLINATLTGGQTFVVPQGGPTALQAHATWQ